MGSPWHVQLRATVRRNLLIKRRDGGNTIQELFLPVYIIFLLVVVKIGTPSMYLPATNWMNKVDGMCQPVEQPLDNVCLETHPRPSNETLLAFVPQSNKGVGVLMQKVLKDFGDWYSPSVEQLSLKGFDSEEDLVIFYNTHPEMVYAGVIFDGADASEVLPSDLYFRIRMNGTYVPTTTEFQGDKTSCHDGTTSCLSDKYLTSGFLALQTTISQVARGLALPTSCGPTKQIKSSFVQKQPLNEFNQSFADTLFQLFSAMYLVWAFAPQLQTTLSHIVEEKENLIKDYMLLMGLRESIYWLSWLIAYALMSAITVCVLVWTAKITTLFEFSSVGALFFLIYAYSLSLTTMAFALSTVFSKAQTASAVSGLLMLFSSLAVIPIELLHLPAPVCALLALFSPAGFAMAINVVVRAEGRGRGVHLLGRRNFWSRSAGLDFSDHKNPLSPGELVIIFLFDAILYAIAAWYLDNTWPHPERGPKRPWGFCFSSRYWFPSRATFGYTLARDNEAKHHVSQQDLDDASLEMTSVPDTALEVDVPEEESNPDIEPVSTNLQSRAGIVMKELRQVNRRRKGWWHWLAGLGRTFRRDQNPVRDYEVVKGLNLTLYEGQCFAIVGHSGSGKSAVVNMLSGFSRATSGDAYIYGLPVTDAGEELRSLIGVCPQQDVAVNSLTIREQLKFFATIKGQCVHFGKDGLEERQHSKETVEQMVENLVGDLGLTRDADKEAKALSKLAKRKLSLAIALIGDPQVVIMDQPTRNLDLVSRKQFWDMMHKRQNGRVILFTTDSMEEADVVADRKAVLSHGVLKCCGSSFFLRNRFGLSYLLHVTKGERFDVQAVWELITKHVPTAVLLPAPRGQAHATYKLPLGIPAQTSALLVELSEHAVELGLEEGALEATTLEEIFMQFQDEDEDAAGVVALRDAQEWSNNAALMDEADDLVEALLVGGERSADVDSVKRRHTSPFSQVSAFLRARLTFPRRNWHLFFTICLIPLVLTLASLIAQMFISSNPSPPPLLLQDLRLGKTLPLFYSVSNVSAGPQALSMLNNFGPAHVLIYPRDPGSSNTADLTDMPNNDETHIVGVSFDKLDFQNCTLQYTIACHPLQIHEVPIVASMMEDFFLEILRKNFSGNSALYAPSSLHPSSHPLPYEINSNSFAHVVVLNLVMGLMFIPSIFCAKVVIEKENGILSLLRVSGMQSAAYWLATLLSDLMPFFGIVSLVLGMGFAFGQPPFIKEAAPAMLLLFLVTVPATVVQGYALSFSFKTAVSAAPFLSLFFLLGAVLPYFMIFDSRGHDLLYRNWHVLLTVIDPPYALTSGLQFIVRAIDDTMSSNGAAPSEMPSPAYFFEWKNYVVVSIVGAVAGLIIYTIVLWQLDARSLEPESKRTEANGAESQVIPRLGSSNDSDLDQEKERVQSSASRWEGTRNVDGDDEPEGDAILCYNLGKTYGSSPGIRGVGAVRGTCVLQDLWLAVGPGEIVVLIGGHKAGKSTLLHCLAGIEPVSVGDAIVCGTSVRYGYLHNLSRIGFCPQHETMYTSMTVKEHLQLFAALKGVAQPQSVAVETALQAMQLSDVADTRIEHCKAGTKRMLSLAVALLGSPPVLMLDEPSSGMDFAKRKRAWKQISAQSSHCTTLICTQSFEEASVLGARVGIIVDGQLKCLAPPLELKRRHGSNYTLLVLADSDSMPEICKFINTLFPAGGSEAGIVAAAEAGDELDAVVGLSRQKQFQVPVRSLSQLARLLQELEAKREALQIKDYVVSQPTLQQVFHRLTQSPPS